MSGDIGRQSGSESTHDLWVYPAKVRVLDRKHRRGRTRPYFGVPLPSDLGIDRGDQLGLRKETNRFQETEIDSIVFSLDGDGEMTRKVRGGTRSKPTLVVSLPVEWVEPLEYPISEEDEPSFLPLEEDERVVLEADHVDREIRLYRSEDYRHRLAGFAAERAPTVRPNEMRDGWSPDELPGMEQREELDIEWQPSIWDHIRRVLLPW